MSEFNESNHKVKLLQLQRAFKEGLPEKISDIEFIWRELCERSSPDFTDLHMKVHSLVGAAGTFGASMVSISARKLEVKIKSLINDEIKFDSHAIEQIDYLVLQIHDIADRWEPSSIPYIPEDIKRTKEEIPNWQANVYLVEDDVEIANPMIQYLEEFGYKVFYYRKIVEFEKDYSKNDKAAAILMDMSFDEGIIAGAEAISLLSEKYENFPPVIFISVHDDIQARLAAARAGARRYFVKPIDNQKLLDSLDTLTHRRPDEPYRVLLIDDDKEVLDYYSTSLKNEGMDVLSFTNPLEGYRIIEHFKPELIILDLYMPECSGLDLAKIIRQDDTYSSIPIVFLSAELEVAAQMAAMDLGGDDFLIKPMSAEYFAPSITSRVKRARALNELNTSVKDALRESEYRLIALDQHAIVSMTDTKGKIIFVNERFVNISGYREDELLGKNHRMLKSGKHDSAFYKNMWATISSGKIWSGQICNKAKQSDNYWLEATIVPFLNEKGLPYKYVSVRTDITKIKESEEYARKSELALLEAKKEADRANAAKSNFLSSMSHELRTPINAINGFAQLIKLDCREKEDERKKDNAQEIIKAGNHLLELINDVLDLAKVESEKIDLLIEQVNVLDVMLECISWLHVNIERRKINLSYQFNGKDISFEDLLVMKIMLDVDRKRLKQIILNLLSNAVKYNRDEGSIVFSYESSNDFLKFNIRDTGKGLSDENLEKLFKSFSRLDEEHGDIEGSGIGLVITKKLVELMGGTIGVDSELGAGSIFWVELPTKVN